MRGSTLLLCAGAALAFAGGLAVTLADRPPARSAAVAAPTLCEGYAGAPDAAARMVRVKGGRFTMGSDDERPEERRAHGVTVSDFWIDKHEVTNAQFRAFVEATGYVTLAERGLGEAARDRLPEIFTRPGSMVFSPPDGPVEDLTDVSKWWQYKEGANWRHPTGPGSSIDGLDNHPVVHITVEDAYAYAKWIGHTLPTEAQWEFAARGGLVDARYTWGSADPGAGGVYYANTFQGAFPHEDAKRDGHHGTAPVGCYEANGYGLYDMGGNVWEYTLNWWVPGHPDSAAHDPRGPLPRVAARYGGPLGPNVTVKGGSWLCAPSYCARYRPSARQPQELAIGSNHIGFRTVRTDAPAPTD